MKRIFIGAGILLIMACTAKAPEFPWANKSFEAVQKSAGEKLIMLDFYTEW